MEEFKLSDNVIDQIKDFDDVDEFIHKAQLKAEYYYQFCQRKIWNYQFGKMDIYVVWMLKIISGKEKKMKKVIQLF